MSIRSRARWTHHRVDIQLRFLFAVSISRVLVVAFVLPLQCVSSVYALRAPSPTVLASTASKSSAQ